MNSFPDFHSDGRAALARSYDYNGSPFDQAFPHLELAMEPRMATRPVSQQEDVFRRSMRQPVRQWHAFDPMGVSTPRYVNQPANTNQQPHQQFFHWRPNAAIPIPIDVGVGVGDANGNGMETSSDGEADLDTAENPSTLAVACIRGDCQAVRALLNEGQDIEGHDRHGLTALDYAVISGQCVVAEILSAAGAVWTRSQNDLATVLIPAVKSGLPNLLRYALSAGADITVTDSGGRMPLHHAVLSARNQFVPCLANAQTVAHADALGNTPLHLATMVSNPIALKALLDRHAALNARNRAGNTALACACSLPCSNAIMLLLRAGADMALGNQFGQHPLHIACLHGQTNHVRMLLASGADVHVRTAYGESALDIARRGNAVAIVSALMLAGAGS